ncbi:MAG: signal peptide peptidase SppA, partial [Burkholderiaceae bacterium]|nr:signal peptide peptidase SppA [Burkholderiaceae bacterium]
NVHVFKAGAYKSFPESFILNAPSKEALAAEKVWLFDAWKTYATDMEGSRGLMPGAIDAYIEELPQRVRNARGDMAQAAINAGLIDGVKTIEEVKDYIETRLGKGKKIEANFVSYLHYGEGLNHIATPGSIAVIVAEGEIHTGPSDVGIIGSKTLLEQIQTAVDDANIKAIILRVNSPGGSAVASELIRGSLETAKKKGKPVVVSMGNTAASGGYWISMGATRVIADPATITGSIGVFGLAPTFEKSLGLAKIGQGGIGTTWLANAGKPTQPLDPRLADILTQNVERTYNNFLTVVAKARQLTINDVHQVAQGRVWTGSQALKHGLVDELGGMHEAFEAARKLAQLPTSTRLVYVSETPMNLASMVRQSLKPLKDPLGSVKIPQALRNEVTQVKDFWTRRLSTPKEVLAHSLCGVEN